MNRNIVRQFLVIVATVGTVVVNALANTLPINGQNTGEISDRFNVYFVPAGYVFSIWGLIYLLLIGYTVYQALPSQREDTTQRKIGWLYVLSAAFNIGWIFVWHYNIFIASMVLMLGILTTLITIYQRLAPERASASTLRRWLIFIPFSVYLGWITVATVANATALLDFLTVESNPALLGIAPGIWFVLILAVATGIGLAVTWPRADLAYGLVLVWAFAGIAAKFWSIPLIGLASAAAAIIIAVAVGASSPRSPAFS